MEFLGIGQGTAVRWRRWKNKRSNSMLSGTVREWQNLTQMLWFCACCLTARFSQVAVRMGAIDPQAWLNLGKCYEATGMYASALKCLERAVEICYCNQEKEPTGKFQPYSFTAKFVFVLVSNVCLQLQTIQNSTHSQYCWNVNITLPTFSRRWDFWMTL